MYPSQIKHERFADGVVHVIGLAIVIAGCLALTVQSTTQLDAPLIAACAVYMVSMALSFASSALYHLLPQHQWRVALRRVDHAAIYALIAGTFTPLLIFMGTTTAYVVLTAVWILAIPAMLYKIFGEQIEPRWSLLSYLGLGWVGILALPDFYTILPTSALIAILAGGFFYTFGTVFYRRKGQLFRYSIWHAFGVLGGVSFFAAIWISLFQ